MPSARWRIALASATGTSHEAIGTPCQDSADHRLIEVEGGSILAIAVSDGAGSAAYSDTGSRLAVKIFLEQVAQFFASGGELPLITAEHAKTWVDVAVDHLRFVADSNGHAVRDYACTLLGAVVGSEQAAFVQIGDGAIVVSHGEEDGWPYVFWPQHGEYANTTNFIQSHDLATVLAFEFAPRRINELAIFSDGIENLVLHKASKSVHESFFRDMIQPVRKSTATGFDPTLSAGLQRYLESKAICERTDDDKTLVLATRVTMTEPIA